MSNKNAITTQVYELPEDPDARDKFVNGVKALADECKAVWVAGSHHNEIDYADLLAEKLSEHEGELAVEGIRQEFERAQRR